MAQKKLPQGLRKRLRYEKARLRREIPDAQQRLKHLARIREELGAPLTADPDRAIENQS